MIPLDFISERDDETESWTRSDPLHAVIRPHNGATWDVKLPGGDWHEVHIRRERGAWSGTCDCKGWEYRDSHRSPCAHLCALRRAHWTAENQPTDPAGRDTYGNHVHIPDAGDDLDDTDPTASAARADGGRIVEPEPVERPADLQMEPRWTGR
ncbi:hypothetical protein [Salarchaeum japonicum]|uniref:hypothetical protein n=1 Tax=Salarchaeum japonicum TaxID=555573 RepID=UPI003C757D8D